MRARALGCFHSLSSTQNFRRELTASVDSCTEIKIEYTCPFSGVTKSGRVWGKVPESDGAGKRCSECGSGIPPPPPPPASPLPGVSIWPRGSPGTVWGQPLLSKCICVFCCCCLFVCFFILAHRVRMRALILVHPLIVK